MKKTLDKTTQERLNMQLVLAIENSENMSLMLDVCYQCGLDFSELYDSQYTKLDFIHLIVSEGANVNTGYALRAAIRSGNIHLVKYLIQEGADISNYNHYALRTSAENGNMELVIFLIEQGADIHAQNDESLKNAVLSNSLPIVQYLVEHGADVMAKDCIAFRMAALNGNLELVAYLLEKGADIHALDDFSLIHSVTNDHLEVVQYLMNHGAQWKAQDFSAITISAESGFFNILYTIIDKQILSSKQIDLIFQYTMKYKDINFLQYMIKRRFDWWDDYIAINHKIIKPFLAFYYKHKKNKLILRLLITAAELDNLDFIKYLLSFVQNKKYYNTTLKVSAHFGRTQTVQWLVEKGADVQVGIMAIENYSNSSLFSSRNLDILPDLFHDEA